MPQTTFKRSFESLEALFGFIERFLSDEQIDAEHHLAVNLAVEELFTNMVKYNADSPADIALRLERVADELRIVLTDLDADPFDPTAVEEADVNRPLEERQPGGLGIFLTRKMMDRVDYEWADRRSTITVTRKLG